MKQLFTIIFLILALAAKAQQISYIEETRYWY